MADINQVAKAFTDFYYATFDRSRAELAPLYVSSFFFVQNAKKKQMEKLEVTHFLESQQRAESMLTFEGAQFSGTASIIEKLVVSKQTTEMM